MGAGIPVAVATVWGCTYVETMSSSKTMPAPALTQQWTLASAATMGSSVRTKGILQEIRALLPVKLRKLLDVQANVVLLAMPKSTAAEFSSTSAIVSKALETIAERLVIPREIEDILSISATERHRWLKDGRLPSAGTRTVKLRGRARKITFHVFDPQRVADILDDDSVSAWREQDAETAAENRRKAAWKAKLKRAQQGGGKTAPAKMGASSTKGHPGLVGWEDFERDGPLR